MSSSIQQELLEARLAELAKFDFRQLSTLPEQEQFDKVESGSRFIVSTWRDTLADSRVKVAVQVYKPVAFGVGTMCAAGFTIDEKGSREQLSDEALAEYL